MKSIVESEPVIKEFFGEERIRDHFPGKNIVNTALRPTIYRTQIRYFRYYEYFRRYYPEIFDASTSVIDVGDTSGMLFQAMGRDGDSVNIDQRIVKKIQRAGLKARMGDIYNLPFEDRSVDYVLSFQTLEHLDSPLKALKEIGRIVRKKAFISIPYRLQTKIYDQEYWCQNTTKPHNEGGWNTSEVNEFTDCHIFEFSTDDFLKLLSFTNLMCIKNFPLDFFSPLGETRNKWGVIFNFFELEPDGSKETECKKVI